MFMDAMSKPLVQAKISRGGLVIHGGRNIWDNDGGVQTATGPQLQRPLHGRCVSCDRQIDKQKDIATA